MKASIRQLRNSTKEVLGAVTRGNTVTITYRGKDFAKIVPIDKCETSVLETDDIFGMWRDHDDIPSVEKHIDNLRNVTKGDS